MKDFNTATTVTPFTTWTHRKGGVYTLLAVTPYDVVIYISHHDLRIWHRPLAEFCDGRFTPSDEPPLFEDEFSERG